MGAFREGFATGTQAGGFGKFFEVLQGELSKAEKRRFQEDVQRRKEESQLKSAIDQIVAQGEQRRETERVKGEERRETEKGKPKPFSLPSLFKPASSITGKPIVAGPGGRLITGEAPAEGVGEEVQTGEFMRRIGLRPTGVGVRGGVSFGGKRQAGFKPFQLTPETETRFKQRVQEGFEAVQGGEINPSTGQPVTNEEIFRLLSSEFPGQANRLKTIFLGGREAESAEDFSSILFGE